MRIICSNDGTMVEIYLGTCTKLGGMRVCNACQSKCVFREGKESIPITRKYLTPFSHPHDICQPLRCHSSHFFLLSTTRNQRFLSAYSVTIESLATLLNHLHSCCYCLGAFSYPDTITSSYSTCTTSLLGSHRKIFFQNMAWQEKDTSLYVC